VTWAAAGIAENGGFESPQLRPAEEALVGHVARRPALGRRPKNDRHSKMACSFTDFPPDSRTQHTPRRRGEVSQRQSRIITRLQKVSKELATQNEKLDLEMKYYSAERGKRGEEMWSDEGGIVNHGPPRIKLRRPDEWRESGRKEERGKEEVERNRKLLGTKCVVMHTGAERGRLRRQLEEPTRNGGKSVGWSDCVICGGRRKSITAGPDLRGSVDRVWSEREPGRRSGLPSVAVICRRWRVWWS